MKLGLGFDEMIGRNKRALRVEDAVEFFNYVIEEKPFVPVLFLLVLLAWVIERWVFSFSNWVPLAVAVWATIQERDPMERIRKLIFAHDIAAETWL